MTSAIDVRVFKTVDDIGKEAIDSLVDDGFFTYGWLKTLETSKPPIKLDPFYVTAYDKRKLVAFTPCFRDIADQVFPVWPECCSIHEKSLERVQPITYSVKIMFYFVTRLGVSAPKSFSTRISMKDYL